MFRISHYMRELKNPAPIGKKINPTGPVVIWNLIRRCNLTCKHCYSISTDKDFVGELSTPEIFTVMKNLKDFNVPVLILSGGEPLLHPDIFDISKRAKEMGFFVGLSTNGTLIDESNIDVIAKIGYDYVGISIDGIRKTHDLFRRKPGAYDTSMNGIRLCQKVGIKVGMRFTLTRDNAHELPEILEIMEQEQIDKFYLSHLNYAGRGNKNRLDDVVHQITRNAMDLIFNTCWQHIEAGRGREFVTGNNDADGVYFLYWVKKHFPDKLKHIHAKLIQWGGNSSGINISNIDNLGNVHPDTFWWEYNLGNVKQRRFSEIWQDRTDPLMRGLNSFPRPLTGRCGLCSYINVCGGNTRVRAYQLTGNFWEEDPACYLSDEEINVETTQSRLQVTPWFRQKKRV